MAQSPAPSQTETAIFAGGCFWCMEAEFSGLAGVAHVTSGFTGGTVPNPSYEQVSTGATGHVESVKIDYDPAKVSYRKLLDVFWSNVDPLDPDGQFCDKGTQYRAGIFFLTSEQHQLADASLVRVRQKYDQPIAAFVRPASAFYPAEEYHQNYATKNRVHYKLYRIGCGRDDRLEQLHHQPEPALEH